MLYLTKLAAQEGLLGEKSLRGCGPTKSGRIPGMAADKGVIFERYGAKGRFGRV